MEIIEHIKAWQNLRKLDLKNKSLGFVPTMGALHGGHLSLVEKSRGENNLTLVSIFVNPTQFNDPKDLKNYPRPMSEDIEKLKSAGADYLLLPSFEELYPDGYNYAVTEKELSPYLCGTHRPGHFQGMLTVVLKLLQVAQAEHAYFGEKDYQQLLLIKKMAEAFFLSTEIIGCPTMRENDGLAMSSRNQLLAYDDRKKAPLFYKELSSQKTVKEIQLALQNEGFEIDYIEDRLNRRFGAVRLGSVRLIDNVEVQP
ncbi:MAG: pantoate--beta-alanine ligase [Oligoflexia bacterium]|nr:pantoate--beta-alanine ligase [Oligoflexia bacterium]